MGIIRSIPYQAWFDLVLFFPPLFYSPDLSIDSRLNHCLFTDEDCAQRARNRQTKLLAYRYQSARLFRVRMSQVHTRGSIQSLASEINTTVLTASSYELCRHSNFKVPPSNQQGLIQQRLTGPHDYANRLPMRISLSRNKDKLRLPQESGDGRCHIPL